MSSFVDFNRNVDQRIAATVLQLQKVLGEPLDSLFDESIACYNIPKNHNETIDDYGKRVTKCTSAWSKHFEEVSVKTKQHANNMKNYQSSFMSKIANCANIVNEYEIEVCQKEQKENYFNELKQFYINLTKK